MRLISKYPRFFADVAVYFSTVIQILLNLLLVVIVIGFGVGVFKIGYDLIHSIRQPLEAILQQILLDVVFILALLEITITMLGYLKDGTVHVRYIVDTILIIMLNEIVSMWFKHPHLQDAIGLSIIVVSLAAVRISVVRYGPKLKD